MKIVWDEPKRLANLDKHGLDFDEITLAFFATSLVVPTQLGRYKSIGRVGDKTVVVIFKRLGLEAVSLISARTANARERGLIMGDDKKYEPGRGYSKEDWNAVSDNPPLTAAEISSARPFAEALPDLLRVVKRTRGRQKTPTKVQVTLRLDQASVTAFRATGAGWQARIDAAVKAAALKLAGRPLRPRAIGQKRA